MPLFLAGNSRGVPRPYETVFISCFSWNLDSFSIWSDLGLDQIEWLGSSLLVDACSFGFGPRQTFPRKHVAYKMSLSFFLAHYVLPQVMKH